MDQIPFSKISKNVIFDMRTPRGDQKTQKLTILMIFEQKSPVFALFWSPF
jgi:hypothetical protein